MDAQKFERDIQQEQNPTAQNKPELDAPSADATPEKPTDNALTRPKTEPDDIDFDDAPLSSTPPESHLIKESPTSKNRETEESSASQPTPQKIHFSNNNQAHLLTLSPNSPNSTIQNTLTVLNLHQPEALLLMAGDAKNLNKTAQAHLTQLLSRGVARTLSNIDAIVIDDGRHSGTAALMGKSILDRGRKTPLLGVASLNEVTWPGQAESDENKEALDPNHSHFILGQGWGPPNELMVQVAQTLAKPKSVVTVLVGGDENAKKQVLQSVRLNWPVIILKDSGGLSNDIAKLAQDRPAFINDPDLAEIIVDGKLYFIQLTGPISAFDRLLEQLLSYQDDDDTPSSLDLVWQRFAVYDKNAKRQQRDFNQIQVWILTLGVVATFLAIVETTFKNSVDITTNSSYWVIDQLLFYILLTIPIAITALIAAANRFSAGNKWILLRASAESLKKEIYRYRARVEIYSDRETRNISREMKLYRKDEMLSRKLMQTEVNVSALKPYTGPIPPKNVTATSDDGLSFLTPDRYLVFRLEDQLNYYQNKAVRLEKRMKQLQWLIYLFSGAGTLLVAIRQELWIAFTTTLVTALATFMEYRQLENTLMRYNQTAVELASIRNWWLALSAEEQADPKSIDKLVGQTETTINSEHAAWVHEMQDTMAELRAEQTETSSEPKKEQEK